MNKKAQSMSGALITLGFALVVAGALFNTQWLLYVGIIFIVAGGAASKLIGE